MRHQEEWKGGHIAAIRWFKGGSWVGPGSLPKAYQNPLFAEKA